MKQNLISAVAAAGALVLWSGVAHADPCEGALPAPGATFTGEVRYIGDGDSLCVGRSPDPASWIEVRVADFYAPELSEAGGAAAKGILEDVAYGQTVRCVAGRRSYDRVVASCTLGGVSLGALLRRRGGAEGGRGYR